MLRSDAARTIRRHLEDLLSDCCRAGLHGSEQLIGMIEDTLAGRPILEMIRELQRGRHLRSHQAWGEGAGGARQ